MRTFIYLMIYIYISKRDNSKKKDKTTNIERESVIFGAKNKLLA